MRLDLARERGEYTPRTGYAISLTLLFPFMMKVDTSFQVRVILWFVGEKKIHSRGKVEVKEQQFLLGVLTKMRLKTRSLSYVFLFLSFICDTSL